MHFSCIKKSPNVVNFSQLLHGLEMKKSSASKSARAKNSTLSQARVELPRSLMPSPGNKYTYKQLVGPEHKMDLVSDITTINVASGALASVTSIGAVPSLVRDWANKWQTVFEEYRLLGLRAIVRLVSGTTTAFPVPPQGVAAIWLDEQNSGAPSSADSRSERHAELSLGPSIMSVADQSICELSWTPHDLADMAWSPTSGATNPLYLKVFTNVADWGTRSDQSNRIQIEVAYRVLFRGLN